MLWLVWSPLVLFLASFFTTVIAEGSFIYVWVTASLLRSPGLFGILANLRNAVVWTVLILPLNFCSSNLSFMLYTHYNWYHHHAYAPHITWFSGKIQIFVPFCFLLFLHCGRSERQNPLNGKFSPFFSFILLLLLLLLLLINSRPGLLVYICCHVSF